MTRSDVKGVRKSWETQAVQVAPRLLQLALLLLHLLQIARHSVEGVGKLRDFIIARYAQAHGEIAPRQRLGGIMQFAQPVGHRLGSEEANRQRGQASEDQQNRWST